MGLENMTNKENSTLNELEMESGNTPLKFFSFFVGDECFAFSMDMLKEIIWVPDTIKVPLTPPAFKGLANLRGSILPIIDLRIIFGISNCEITEQSRAIIIDIGYPIGIIIDRVDKTLDVEEAQIERNSISKDSEGKVSNFLQGVIKNGDNNLIQIIDIKNLIEQEFLSTDIISPSKKETQEKVDIERTAVEREFEEERQIVTFLVGEEEFAIEVEFLQEIIEYPEEIHVVPNSDPSFLGVINYRNQVLPILHIGEILEMKMNIIPEKSKVLVILLKTDKKKGMIGIVVEKVKEILKVSSREWSSLPELMDDSDKYREISAICKLDDGKRIISVLSVNTLIDESQAEKVFSITEEFSKERDMAEIDNNSDVLEEEKQLVVFKLKDQEYGIFIEHIQEIILVPEKINKVPHTPPYIEGMINLRGGILPVIDMRKRLGEEPEERKDSQRILVLTMEGIKTGFIVDSVKEVLSFPVSKIEPSPKMSERQAELMDKVINLEDEGRIILIINAEKLLTEEELDEIKELREES